jgi:hypothetical protein
MRRRSFPRQPLFESLESRRLLFHGYAATEVTWLPATATGLVPMQINASGLFTVTDNGISFVCSVIRHRAYAAPDNFSAAAMNDQGVLVGVETLAGGKQQAAEDIFGSLSALPQAANLNAENGELDTLFMPTSINNNGAVAGIYTDNFPSGQNGEPAVNAALVGEFDGIVTASEITSIGLATPAPVFINDAGQIAFTTNPGGSPHPARFDANSGQITTIGSGTIEAQSTGINKAGNIVGKFGETNGGFFFNASTQTTDTFPATAAVRNFSPDAINNNDVIVGTAQFLEKVRNHHAWQQRAAVFTGGEVLDLNTLISTKTGTLLTQAVSINGSDQILADDAALTGSTGDSGDHVLILAPSS